MAPGFNFQVRPDDLGSLIKGINITFTRIATFTIHVQDLYSGDYDLRARLATTFFVSS